jgi:hypothetical protein
VRELLDSGADLNIFNRKTGVYPLSIAMKRGNFAILLELLKSGADPDNFIQIGETPLLMPFASKNYMTTRILLEHGANVNVSCIGGGSYPLYEGCQRANFPTVQLLMKYGADPDKGNYHGFDYMYESISWLCCVREYCIGQLLDMEYLPLDMFREIMKAFLILLLEKHPKDTARKLALRNCSKYHHTDDFMQIAICMGWFIDQKKSI